jgi:flagella basal body P-ring formation protein FlgA
MKLTRSPGLMALAVYALAALCSGGALSGGPSSLESARNELAAALQARHPEVTRIELSPVSGEPRRRPGAARIEFDLEIPADVHLEKRVRTIAVTTDGRGATRRLPFWWAVKAFGPVTVARRGLRAGEQVHPSDLAIEERDIAGSAGYLLSADPGLGEARWRVTRFIRPGGVLRRSDLEPSPEVLRGQEIRVSVVSDVFTVETTGIARDEGRVGEVIAVSRPGTAERYFAEVTGQREALIRGKP